MLSVMLPMAGPLWSNHNKRRTSSARRAAWARGGRTEQYATGNFRCELVIKELDVAAAC
jgi:hypothetical protein